MVKVKCPVCGAKFTVADVHRPFRCPKCGSVLDIYLNNVRVLISGKEVMAGERA